MWSPWPLWPGGQLGGKRWNTAKSSFQVYAFFSPNVLFFPLIFTISAQVFQKEECFVVISSTLPYVCVI